MAVSKHLPIVSFETRGPYTVVYCNNALIRNIRQAVPPKEPCTTQGNMVRYFIRMFFRGHSIIPVTGGRTTMILSELSYLTNLDIAYQHRQSGKLKELLRYLLPTFSRATCDYDYIIIPCIAVSACTSHEGVKDEEMIPISGTGIS